MGLDQYAYTKGIDGKEEIAYWRKHNALQGWMEELWFKRGCPRKNKNDPAFNCIPLQLNLKHLDKLEKDVIENNLPETTGFFFGSDSREDDGYKQMTLEFIDAAKQAISEGKKVFYYSWW